jgi:HSP20 family protein
MSFEITPWRTFGGLRPFRRSSDREDFLSRVFREMPLERGWSPAVDVSETNGTVMVRAELPGLEAKDIDVDVTDNVLTIRGNKKMEEEKQEEQYYCRESYFGSFQRAFRLPAGVKGEEVDASFKNGVLKISIPKSKKSAQKKIEIKT